jgi:hypothetical protein
MNGFRKGVGRVARPTCGRVALRQKVAPHALPAEKCRNRMSSGGGLWTSDRTSLCGRGQVAESVARNRDNVTGNLPPDARMNTGGGLPLESLLKSFLSGGNPTPATPGRFRHERRRTPCDQQAESRPRPPAGEHGASDSPCPLFLGAWRAPLAADEFGGVCHAWPGFAGQACRFGTDIRERRVNVFGDRCRIEEPARSTRTASVHLGVVDSIRQRKSNTCLSRKAGPSMAHENSQDAVWGSEIPSANIRGHTPSSLPWCLGGSLPPPPV